jgi:MoaA/NifB/PqqE/SkfB family radical SAM enzyme
MAATMPDDTLPRLMPIADEIDFAFYPRVPEISLELTNVCNLTCPYCANPLLTRPKGTIEWDLLELIVEQSARDRLSIDWLHGVGEPLLWKRLEEAIRLIRGRNAGAASFATNGTLLFEDRVRQLLDAGLGRIYVSIDTLDPAVYKATRGGNLRKVVDNVKAMIRIVPPDFLIRIALMDHRDSRLTGLERLRFAEVFGVHPNVFLNNVNNVLMPSAPSDYRVESGRQGGCHAPRQYLFINKDGIVSLCCSDQDSLHALGDVRTRSIREIWFDPRNQTTFRNIALGVKTCPSLCTEKCVLAQPKTSPTLRVASAFALPFDAAKAQIAALLDRDRIADAAFLTAALLHRDPLDAHLAEISRVLESLSGSAVAPPPQADIQLI